MTGAELVPLELAGRLALAFGLAVFLGLAFEEVYKREGSVESRRKAHVERQRVSTDFQSVDARQRAAARASASYPPIIIIAVSLGRGRFDAVAEDGTLLAHSTPVPFLAGFRRLVELGCDPTRRAIMRHAGSATDSITGPISVAAG
jgi:hypothetical protein